MPIRKPVFYFRIRQKYVCEREKESVEQMKKKIKRNNTKQILNTITPKKLAPCNFQPNENYNDNKNGKEIEKRMRPKNRQQ